MKLHHLTLKKAIEQYQDHAGNKEEIDALLALDKRGFDEDQRSQIYEGIQALKQLKQPKEKASKVEKHIVSSEFRDQSDFNKKWEVGADVSHFNKERLKKLLELNLVKVL